MASATVFSDEEVVVDDIPESQDIPNDADIEGELRSMMVQEETENGPEGTHHAADSSNGSQNQNDSMPISPTEESKGKAGYFSFLKKLPSFKSKKNGTSKDDEVVKKLAAKISACRHSLANADGGLKNTDHEGIRISRSVVTEIVKQVGKSILSGKNLMSVTFPVRCCQPRTILECAAYQFCFCSHFLGRAARTKDPVERLKLVTSCFVACLHTTNQFVKPFNPTLGETLQAHFPDGTQLYLEQTSHHPPVTSWNLVGPAAAYSYNGWSTYSASFGYNKLMVQQKGLRLCEFAGGEAIEVGFGWDRYNNVYWGEVVQEVLGEYHFRDERNGLVCSLRLDPGSGLPSDAFLGAIVRTPPSGGEAEHVCGVEGSWLGFLDFDGARYWDIFTDHGMAEPILRPIIRPDPLPSDSRFRSDKNALAAGDVPLAQSEKTRIEEAQRRDRRLRADHPKAR